MNNILPSGYYTVELPKQLNQGLLVRFKKGPYRGIQIELQPKIKIREEVLTGTPNLLYNYKILDYAGFDSNVTETSEILSRIIAAVAVEIISKQIEDGATIESV